ncbi:hypothetical protein Leryth_011365 [Lithospermum erythrorhizon]|uniref:Uncharacterized protein n=1 Tax=Lithospermum erythrorhizon TaxID=34254 RepID=A0AAV3Q201_LITER|nr:hypothetical protein Leryth_011365 [Lithospermum erythrorhizon]
MDSKKSNKIRDIVRLQQILKKWKKVANASSNNASSSTNNANPSSNTNNGGSKSIKFLKKTLSFTESTLSSNTSTSNDSVVPKGYLAVCVGRELKRFVIPMEYLTHQAFGILLREAEEEFGFQQEGVLKIPCEVSMFEKILKMMEQRRGGFFLHEMRYGNGDSDQMSSSCYSSSPDHHNCELISPSHHAQLCR